MAPLYDLFLLLDPAAPDERRAEIVANAQAAISGGGGEVVGVHDWGLRQMTYEIDHKGEAEYHFIQFTAPPELIEQLNRPLQITDGLMRHRIIRLDPGTPPPPGPPPARERNVIDERDRDDDDERPRSRRPSYESR